MKINVRDLKEAALDWAVGIAEQPDGARLVWKLMRAGNWNPSKDDSLGGPIIDRNRISVICCDRTKNGQRNWAAQAGCQDPESSTEHQSHAPMYQFYVEHMMFGPTRLVAGLRCFVAHKLGQVVEVPDELLQADRTTESPSAAPRQRMAG